MMGLKRLMSVGNAGGITVMSHSYSMSPKTIRPMLTSSDMTNTTVYKMAKIRIKI